MFGVTSDSFQPLNNFYLMISKVENKFLNILIKMDRFSTIK